MIIMAMFITVTILVFIMASIPLTILSLNIGGSVTLGGLPAILELEKPDIVFLQEVHVNTEALDKVVSRHNYKAMCNINTSDERTLGTAFVWRIGVPVTSVNSVVECRLQSAIVAGQLLLNVYAPSGQLAKNARRTFFGSDVFMAIRGVNDGKLPIIGGDFNCILHDEDSPSNQVNKKCPALLDLVNVFNFCDAFRLLHPNVLEYTWFRPNYAPSRLDRFYVPQHLAHKVHVLSHHASLSDHSFVKMV